MPREGLPALWLARAAEAYPKHIALITKRDRLDFETLYVRIGGLSAQLTIEGLKSGSPLAIITPHAGRVAWATYLSWYRGCPLLPLHPRRTGLVRLLEDCAIAQALIDDEIDLTCPPHIHRISSKSLDLPADSALTSPCPASPADIQLIIATTGTSGVLRAVMLTGENLAAAVAGSRRRLTLGPADVWLTCLPLVHIGGLSILFRCAQAGATVLLHEGFDVARIWDDLRRYSVTHLSLVPTMLTLLLDHAKNTAPPPALRTVLVGGAALSDRLARRARDATWPICVTYGLSETASQVATLCRLQDSWQAGDVGKPLSSVQLDIVDDSGIPTTGPGRIRISGPVVMAGYANPRGQRGLGLTGDRLITNDYGYLDTRGHLHVLGRADDVIVSGGENIHPQEVEGQLLTCPGVEDVAVVGIPDETWGHRIVALVSGEVDESILRLWCKQHLPSAQRPRRFVKVGQLPRNSLGKLDRGRLRDLFE